MHCRTQQEASTLLKEIGQRLKECMLEIHPSKSKVVYCKDSNRTGTYPVTAFTFLGFDFRPRKVRSKQGRKFISFAPAVSRDALAKMRREIKGWQLHRRTGTSLQELADQYNPTLRGWIGYYGRFNGSSLDSLFNHLDLRLSRWAQCKFKKLKRHRRASREWLAALARQQPFLFAHWKVRGNRNGE